MINNTINNQTKNNTTELDDNKADIESLPTKIFDDSYKGNRASFVFKRQILGIGMMASPIILSIVTISLSVLAITGTITLPSALGAMLIIVTIVSIMGLAPMFLSGLLIIMIAPSLLELKT